MTAGSVAPGQSQVASAAESPQVPTAEDERPLVLDELSERLEQFRLLRDSDQEATDRILNELGAQGRVENEMVRELAARKPLAHPERFAEAHMLAMHALEVLARNGARDPSQLRLGPLTPPARFFVQRVIKHIVRTHQTRVITAIHDLYARRSAWTPAGDPARVLLIRARLDAQRTSGSLKKSGSSLPTFLVGGAALSSLLQLARGGATAAAGSRPGWIVGVLVTFLLFAAVSWIVLHAAAIARRRIRLTMDRPLGALWETVGSCGHPPKDSARNFAIVAIILTVAGWIVIPLGALLLFTIF